MARYTLKDAQRRAPWRVAYDKLLALLADAATDDFPTTRHSAKAKLDELSIILAAEVLDLRAEVERLKRDNDALHSTIENCVSAGASLQASLIAERENADRLAGNLEHCMKVLPEPDRRICCSGAAEQCGCMGATVHQEAEHYAQESLAAHMKMRGK